MKIFFTFSKKNHHIDIPGCPSFLFSKMKRNPCFYKMPNVHKKNIISSSSHFFFNSNNMIIAFLCSLVLCIMRFIYRWWSLVVVHVSSSSSTDIQICRMHNNHKNNSCVCVCVSAFFSFFSFFKAIFHAISMLKMMMIK